MGFLFQTVIQIKSNNPKYWNVMPSTEILESNQERNIRFSYLDSVSFENLFQSKIKETDKFLFYSIKSAQKSPLEIDWNVFAPNEIQKNIVDVAIKSPPANMIKTQHHANNTTETHSIQNDDFDDSFENELSSPTKRTRAYKSYKVLIRKI